MTGVMFAARMGSGKRPGR